VAKPKFQRGDDFQVFGYPDSVSVAGDGSPENRELNLLVVGAADLFQVPLRLLCRVQQLANFFDYTKLTDRLQ